MFFEEFKASLLYAKLPTHWATEAAVAVLTFAVVFIAVTVLDSSDRTTLFVAALCIAWFGSRIAIVAVRGRRARPKRPGRLD